MLEHFIIYVLKNIWNKLSIKTRLLIGTNAYKSIYNNGVTTSLLNNYARTLSMMHWSELDKKEKTVLEKYSKSTE
jgi:hypothetical protein